MGQCCLRTVWATTWQNQQNGYAPSENWSAWAPSWHPPSLITVFAVCMKKAWVLSYTFSTQRRLWSDWVDAQTDLSLRWAHTQFVGFVMSWLSLIWVYTVCPDLFIRTFRIITVEYYECSMYQSQLSVHLGCERWVQILTGTFCEWLHYHKNTKKLDTRKIGCNFKIFTVWWVQATLMEWKTV